MPVSLGAFISLVVLPAGNYSLTVVREALNIVNPGKSSSSLEAFLLDAATPLSLISDWVSSEFMFMEPEFLF